MAMIFTLVTHLRERLSALQRERQERIRKEEMEKERRALEVRHSGVPCCPDADTRGLIVFL